MGDGVGAMILSELEELTDFKPVKSVCTEYSQKALTLGGRRGQGPTDRSSARVCSKCYFTAWILSNKEAL